MNISKQMKSLVKKSKAMVNGGKNKKNKEAGKGVNLNGVSGTASTESTASILEAIQTRMLQEEDKAWNSMELSLGDESKHQRCRDDDERSAKSDPSPFR